MKKKLYDWDSNTLEYQDKYKNHYILKFIGITPNHQTDLIQENGITVLKYRFNVRGWC